MKRILIMYLDYTGLPRAWGLAPADRRADAERVAKEQLDKYCANKRELGEVDLADPKTYSRVEELYDGPPAGLEAT